MLSRSHLNVFCMTHAVHASCCVNPSKFHHWKWGTDGFFQLHMKTSSWNHHINTVGNIECNFSPAIAWRAMLNWDSKASATTNPSIVSMTYILIKPLITTHKVTGRRCISKSLVAVVSVYQDFGSWILLFKHWWWQWTQLTGNRTMLTRRYL